MQSYAVMDIEDGTEGAAPPPRSLSVTKKFATCVTIVGTIVAMVYYGMKYEGSTGLELKRTKLTSQQMGGDFSFRIFDSGSTDKMLLRLQVQKGKQYTIQEHSRRTITRGIVLPNDAVLDTAKAIEQDVAMSFNFHLEEMLDSLKAVRLRFNCTEFSIRHRNSHTDKWEHPPIWSTMGQAVLHHPFSATVAHNGTILEIDAKEVHQAVVAQMHQVGALPVEMTTALEITQPSPAETFDSLGAQWNAPGMPTVEGPVIVAEPLLACPERGMDARDSLNNADQVAGMIVLVKRGKCTFLEKVRMLHELTAVGVVVMDSVDEDLLLMGGSTPGEKLIPSVMVKQEVGNHLKDLVQHNAPGEVWVKLLTGVEAMTKKGSVGALGGDKAKKAALPDFLGYNSMIEDQIKRRFTIFPGGPVGIGDTWHRKVKMQLEGQSVPTWVDEQYTMLEMPPAPPCERSRWSTVGHCDSTAARKGPVRIMLNTTAIQKAAKGGPGGAPRTPAGLPGQNSEDISVKEAGTILVDAASGMLLDGSAEQVMTGKARFTQVFIDGKMQEGAYLRTKMDAQTQWRGSLGVASGAEVAHR